MIDLPNISVLTMGLDRWDVARCLPIDEDRLLQAVRSVLGGQVERLRMPPMKPDGDYDRFSAEALVGAPVRPFPRWLRCVKCQILAEVDSGLFDIKENPFRPEDTRFVHKHCEKGANSDAVPARFLLACRNGHLDDFPWRYFVHEGPSGCKGSLVFIEEGASLQTENLWVKCTGCGAARSMVLAFGREGTKHLPVCRGRHPHLSTFDECCSEQPRTVLLGSTNSWFSVSISVLAIPQAGNALEQLVDDGWTYFEDTESDSEVKAVLKTLTKTGALPGIEVYSAEAVRAQIETRRAGKSAEAVRPVDIKRPEWTVLIDDKAPNDWPNFKTSKTDVPATYLRKIDSVLLLERLKEVNALVGFTRVESPEESDDPDDRPPMASLCRGKPSWVPAFEVHGEGIFIRFNEAAIREWEEKASVAIRDKMLLGGHIGWRNARQLEATKGYPGARYAMLHTFSHLLIRELALECGYNTASIRERIYSDSSSSAPMAGILIYTAAADSDGTLGGLVELGKPENLGRLINQALHRASICSSDPLCSEHDASADRSLHGAACHGCSFVAETSCEKGNRYLDRAFVTGTFDATDAAFFDISQSADE
jgi:hypothetical protein